MKRICKLFLIVACPLTISGVSDAQVACHFGEGQTGQAYLEKALTAAPSCRAADKILSRCAWGSSADLGFAGTVQAKCEKDFLTKLSTEQKTAYKGKLALCAYEFGGQEGTISISEDALCQSDIAFRYATDPKAAAEPVPAASFDCLKARSPIEITICNNSDLGRADIIMSRAYKPFLHALAASDKITLIQSQRTWNKNVPTACSLLSMPASAKVVACLVKKYEQRAHDLDGCSRGMDMECVAETDKEEQNASVRTHL